MTLQPLLTAPASILLHVATVVPAFLIGSWSLFLSTKGSVAHRIAGRAFAVLMAVTAATTLFIPGSVLVSVGVGPFRFSPIHLLVPLTAVGLWRGIAAIRRGDLALHRQSMQRLYLGALVIAGLFTLAPGRVAYRMLFG